MSHDSIEGGSFFHPETNTIINNSWNKTISPWSKSTCGNWDFKQRNSIRHLMVFLYNLMV